METIYRTYVGSEMIAETADLETAVRAWNGATYLGAAPAGGIAVASHAAGCQVRDGWILHVDTEGRVYLNPGMH